MNYIEKLALMFDELVNAIFDGHRNETISARAGRAQKEGRLWGCVLCGILDVFQKNHCAKALAFDQVILDAAPEAEKEADKID